MTVTTRIHVNQHNIKANRKGATLLVLTVKNYKHNLKCNTATIYDDRHRVVARII